MDTEGRAPLGSARPLARLGVLPNGQENAGHEQRYCGDFKGAWVSMVVHETVQQREERFKHDHLAG